MSILVKSNSLYTGSSILPTAKQLSTNPEAVYNEYVARVEADGGEVTDKAKLMDAIQFMFKQNLYGRMSTVVAPLYGKKLDSNGKLLKLYAIDGDDLVSVSYGGAPLPHIDAHNQVVFNDTIVGAEKSKTGSLMTTDSKKPRSILGRIGVAVRTWDPYGVDIAAESHRIFGITNHSNLNEGFREAYFRGIQSVGYAGTINVYAIKSEIGYKTNSVSHTATNAMTDSYASSTVSFFDTNLSVRASASRYNPRYGTISYKDWDGYTFEDRAMVDTPTYIDFGGYMPNQETIGFGRFSCAFFWLFSDMTTEQVKEFQVWQVKHYPLPI